LAVPTLLAISPNLLRSDHVPFWAQGIGALMVTDTANFRNPNYHRASDTVETIDRRFLGDSTQVVLDAAIGLLE
jgi:Zn-dependent M28 family amino/carboxypeptidase